MIRSALVALAVVFTFATAAEARLPGSSYQCEAEGIASHVDAVFQVAARRHLPVAYREDWCILKALCWIESRLEPGAQSHVGALGLCRVMPATGRDFLGRLKLRGAIRDARTNAELGAAVLAHMLRIWSYPRSKEHRLELGAASYNAGPKHLIEAQRLSGGRLCWDLISGYLADRTPARPWPM